MDNRHQKIDLFTSVPVDVPLEVRLCRHDHGLYLYRGPVVAVPSIRQATALVAFSVSPESINSEGFTFYKSFLLHPQTLISLVGAEPVPYRTKYFMRQTCHPQSRVLYPPCFQTLTRDLSLLGHVTYYNMAILFS